MSKSTRTGLESAGTNAGGIDTLDDRDVRALTECMTVLQEAPGLYTVIGENHGEEDRDASEYTVDLNDWRCSCPDSTYRQVHCKHIRRCEFATGARPIPPEVDRDDVDPLLGDHVEGPRFLAADGGVVAPGELDEQERGTCPNGEAFCPVDNPDADDENLECWSCRLEGPVGTPAD